MAAEENINPQQFRTRVQNIRNVYNASSVRARSAGLTWYEDVNEAVAKGVRGTSTSPASGAGMVSAVSPSMDWEGRNIHALSELHGLRDADFKAIAKGDRSPLRGTSIAAAGKNAIGKAHRIMQGEHPDDVLIAPKTNSFFHNIHEPQTRGPVTIDGRAYDIAENKMKGWQQSRGISAPMQTPGGRESAAYGRYKGLVDAYTSAADAVHQETGRVVHPHQMQAITWMGGKEIERSTPTKRGKPRKVGVRRSGQPYV